MPKKPVTFRRGNSVYDSWWPHRIGRVLKVLKTRLHVQWSDGQVVTYDKPHQRFLRKVNNP
jgi:hypothetical protein